MAINLLGNYNIANNAYNSLTNEGNVGANSASSGVTSTAVINNSEILKYLRELLPGQTLDGKLISQDGESLQLLLKNNTLLNTTLDSNTLLSVGQNMTFEVKGNNNGQLVLRPLNTNTAMDSTAMKALESASVNVNDETIKMVNSLMKEGMSISKEMLQTINREINMFPDADIEDIVLLHKFDLPVTESNIEQMHLFNNNNQWMNANIENMSEDMMEALKNMADDPETLAAFADKLESLFEDENIAGAQSESGMSDASLQPEGKIIQEQIHLTDAGNMSNKEAGVKENAAKVSESGIESVPKDDADALKKDNVFDFIRNLTPEKLSRKETFELIKNGLGEAISNKMLMEPEQVADKETVKNYYDKILNIARELEGFMAQNDKADSSLSKDMSGLKNNIDFMNQINELYNYVQLPLKMSGNMTKGDLYVYSRKAKKGERQADEPLTALLHLSMDYLGNMDIFLKLKQDKLTTDFSLEKEEMIDFIASHIDELNARLIAKGYNVETNVKQLEDTERTVIDTIKSESPQITLLSTQSFDARA